MIATKDRTLQLTDKLYPFLSTPKRFKIAFGGRSGTKSYSVAEILLYLVDRYGYKVGCFREHQNTIEDSVHSLLSDLIQRRQLDEFKIHKATIEHQNGGKFRFKGLARSAEGVKSFNGFNIFWLEEAQFISQQSFKMLTPTLREEGSECWLTLNPLSRLDHVSQRFILPFYKELLQNGIYEDDLHYIVWTNYDENPWMPETLDLERQLDEQILSTAEYDHIWLGHFNDTVENAVIHAEWFDAAIDAHKKLKIEPTGAEIVAHDPSDLGPDDKALVHRHGILIKDAKVKSTGNVNEGFDWAIGYAREVKPDWFVWDANGIGLPFIDQVERAFKGTKTDFIAFNSNNTVEEPEAIYSGTEYDRMKSRTNKDSFYNLRAQKIWHLRDRFVKTYLAVEKGVYTNPADIISISSDIECLDLLRSETCRIPRVPNRLGKIQIMSKEMMLSKLKIQSPNVFDATTMTELNTSLYMDNGPGLVINQQSLWK